MAEDARILTLLNERSRLLAFVEKRVGSRELAEEILQDAFVRSIEKASEVRDDESVIAWFYRVLRNAIIDRHRRNVARERASAALALASTPEAPDEDSRGEICRCMTPLIETLKPEYRDALREVDLAGATVSDLARSQGITPGNASVRVHRARQALGRALRTTCGACAEHGCLDCGCRLHS